MQIELEDNDVLNAQVCIVRVAKLPDVPITDMQYLLSLVGRIEAQKPKPKSEDDVVKNE